MELIPCSFWVRGVSFIESPGIVTADDLSEIEILAEENEYQSKKYPGTLAYKVVTSKRGIKIGWVPGELCGWVMEHEIVNPFISKTKDDPENRTVGIEVSFLSDEQMPRQQSVGGA